MISSLEQAQLNIVARRKRKQALRQLNDLGYGDELVLNLVYNPVGAVLPPPQQALEEDYRRELYARFGIRFNNLFTITNMPISRYLDYLIDSGNLDGYMNELISNFNPRAIDSLMCRDMISVGWDGGLYDCDFNQMLDLPLLVSDRRRHISTLLTETNLDTAPIRTGEHCYGCAAGQGSSCGGALEA